jgi:hypothetical protein
MQVGRHAPPPTDGTLNGPAYVQAEAHADLEVLTHACLDVGPLAELKQPSRLLQGYLATGQ